MLLLFVETRAAERRADELGALAAQAAHAANGAEAGLVAEADVVLEELLHEALAYLGQLEVVGGLLERDHLRLVGKLLKDAQTPRQHLLLVGALLAHLQLLDLLHVLVQLQVVQYDGHEQTEQDLFVF